MGFYLCYDIRGIQSFIFRIPKLKYIIGGSALIDEFDRETVKMITVTGSSLLYSGGGKGAFICENATAAANTKAMLIAEAHRIGLDIRFGADPDFEKAGRNASELYPFVPELLDGEPCPKSGLYPVNNNKEHAIVKSRIFNKGEKKFRYFEDIFLSADIFLPGTHREQWTFLGNVNANDEENPDIGSAGAASLGNRNRWAVICMDGNDMGTQLRAMEGKPDAEKIAWVREMSRGVDECCQAAATAGIQRVIALWAKTKDFRSEEIGDTVVLPIRPLLVGGDDIIVLCHVSHAMTFVEEVARVFAEKSAQLHTLAEKKGIPLWRATDGALTISAGVLFCPVSLPLHTAIDYAESLLASAKSRGRRDQKMGKPSPACVDWEQVTDSIIDSPSARRQREMVFIDADDKNAEISLTTRPCTLDEYHTIKALAKTYESFPATIRHKILPGMRQGLDGRIAFIAEIAKHQCALATHLSHPSFPVGKGNHRWKIEGNKMATDVIDALLLLEEAIRMQKETV